MFRKSIWKKTSKGKIIKKNVISLVTCLPLARPCMNRGHPAYIHRPTTHPRSHWMGLPYPIFLVIKGEGGPAEEEEGRRSYDLKNTL